MHLGTFAHDVFEHMRGDLSSFSTVFDQRLDQALLTSKERILFRHLKPKLEEVARFNDHHQRHMTQPTFIEEMPISIPIDEHTVLQGVIDRTILLSDEHGNEYVALMDYKSGSESFDGSLMEYGWSLQLPIYALMIHAHPELKHRELLGVFIQHILHKSMKKNVIEIGKDIFPTTYQLDGVVVSETKKAALLDRNLGNQPSLFLQATKPASLEYLKENAHVVSSSYLASMQTTAKTKIIEASGHIRSRHYPLNPRTIKNKSSCDYCPFQDVCFRQSQDVTIIRVKKEEDTSDESN
jgi:ATP-dependent helicase/nuclease subunit B